MNEHLWNEPFDLPAVTKSTEAVRPYPADLPNVSWQEAAFGRASSPSVVDPPALVAQLKQQLVALEKRLKRAETALATRLQHVETELAEVRSRPQATGGVVGVVVGDVTLAGTPARTPYKSHHSLPAPTPRAPAFEGSFADHVEASEEDD